MSDKIIKILLLEDSPVDAELMGRELKKGGVNFESLLVDNSVDFKTGLRTFSPDIILCDHSLVSFNSIEALKIVKESGYDVPFILVTGTVSEEFAVDMMKQGVSDYILKDRLQRLPTAVLNAIERKIIKNERKRFLLQVSSSEKSLRKSQAIGQIGHWELSFATGIAEWSDESCRIYGLDPMDNRQSFDVWASFLHPDDVDFVMELVKKQRESLSDSSFDHRIKRRNGSIRHVHSESTYIFDANRKPVGLYGIALDITERKKAEEKIIKTNRLYSFISHINQTIVHVKDEEILFKKACSIAYDIGKFKMAWIGIFDKDNKKISVIEQKGIDNDDMHLFMDASYQNNGPQAQILRSGNYYSCNNIQDELELESWKSFALKHNIQSCLVLPIRKGETIIGSFNLYAGEINFFDSVEIEMLLEATGDISFALQGFEKEKRHKATEELVIKNEKHFRALIEKTSDMITLSTPEGKMLYASPAITKVLGYTLEEFPRLFSFHFIHPDDLPAYAEKRTKLLENPGQSFYNQNRFLHKNGNWVWCEGTVTNMLHEDGINALVSNFRDISEKIKSEEEKEFNNNNLSALINNTTALMWSVDKDYNLITSNIPFDEFGKLNFGKTISKGENVLSVSYTPEMLSHFKQRYERAFSGESFTETEYFDYPTEFWTEISYYPIRKGDEVIGTACHSRDITERKKSEKNLKQSEERYRQIIETSNEGIWLIDENNKTAFVNKRFIELFGYSFEEMMGKTNFDLMDDEGKAIALEKMEKRKKGIAESFELVYFSKEGKKIWANVSASPINNDDGKYMGALAMLTDITQKRNSELEREKIVADIIQRNKDLEQFAYIVSHNLRLPVANIIGIANIFKNDILNETQKIQFMDAILTSVKKLDAVVNDLNYVLQVKRDINENRELVYFPALIENIRDSIQNIIDRENVKITIDFSAIDTVTSIKSYMHSIFYNLISNSIKYRQKNIPLLIEIKSKMKGEKIVFSIKDNGMGIDLEKNKDIVFGLYKRFHTEDAEGKGMGLFMVKTQVETLGGKISVESEVNKGTEFCIEFEQSWLN